MEENEDTGSLLSVAVECGNIRACINKIETSSRKVTEEEIIKHLLLHSAIENDEPRILEVLLEAIRNQEGLSNEVLSAENASRQTVLHFAIRVRNIECCSILINEGRCRILSIRDDEGNTPLHYIAEEKLIPTFNLAVDIIKEDGKLNMFKSSNRRNENILHAASKAGSDEIIRQLHNLGCSLLSKSNNGYTPLHFAANNGHKNCIEIILKNIQENKLPVYMNSITRSKRTPLMLAAEKGFSESCHLLKKTDVNKQDKEGWTALHYAARKGSVRIIKMLLTQSADCTILTKHNKTALMFAVSNDNEESTIVFLEDARYPDVSYKPYETLRLAVLQKSFKCVPILLGKQEFKAVMNEVDSDGNTVLHHAIKFHSYDIALTLLQSGAKRNLVNKYDEYPLHFAAQIHAQSDPRNVGIKLVDGEIIDLLVRNSGHIGSHITREGKNCLHLCAESGNSYLLKHLLNRDCNIYTNNSRGQTPIQVAVAEYHNETVQILVDYMKKNDSNKILREIHKASILAIEVDNIEALKLFVDNYSVIIS